MIDEKQRLTLSGEVDSIVFKSETSAYGVIMLDTGDDLESVTGSLADVQAGEMITVEGYYENNAKYGLQFRAEVCYPQLPASTEGIFKYLSSGVIKGLKAKVARRIVDLFGEESFDVIENDYMKLTQVEGISKKTAKKIHDGFAETNKVRSLLTFLKNHGISADYGYRAWNNWGEQALEMIQSNPYVLCSPLVALSFEEADALARKLGIAADSEHRIAAYMEFLLNKQAEDGNTAMPITTLGKQTTDRLGVTSEQFKQALRSRLDDEMLFCYEIDRKKHIMLRSLFTAESFIARRLCLMRQLTYDTQTDFSAVIDLEEQNNGIKYEKTQREAINLALSKGFLVLTGGPGTGKTTTLNAIISLYQQQGLEVFICAPTGRAAKRISDLTGFEAKTIHRLLEAQYVSDGFTHFKKNENDMLDCDALIIDEMSMVDAQLFEAVLRAVSINCKLVLVGDSDQLPSVSAGNVLKDIIDSGAMSVVRLTEVFRQAERSKIVVNAHRIVEGEPVDLSDRSQDSDFYFMQRTDPAGVSALVCDLFGKRLPEKYHISPMLDMQLITPTHMGPAGTAELNKTLQQLLNPKAAGKSEIKSRGTIFRTGDKVMQIRNDYQIQWKRKTDEGGEESGAGIINGDIGYIEKVNKLLGICEINFDGRVAVYSTSLLENIVLAYAITVHKSQGSEFDYVVVTLYGGSERLYYRNLLYTAVTRAKKMLIVVGSTALFNKMIRSSNRNTRITALKPMIQELAGEDDDTEL